MDAKQIIENRASTHGDFKNVSFVAQSIKEIIAESAAGRLSPQQHEALDLIATKIARIVSGNPDEPDHWLDIEGYARLARESINK
jgi:hypothetical protein